MGYKNWQKQFDEKFPRMFAGSAGQYDRNGDTRPYYNDSVKEFISSLLQQKDQEWKDKIKEVFEEYKLYSNDYREYMLLEGYFNKFNKQ